jgi:lipopolysaccharide export system permease protein
MLKDFFVNPLFQKPRFITSFFPKPLFLTKKIFFSKTIFLYIAREILFAFFVCFLFFFFCFFVNQLLLMAGEILAKRVPVYQVALLVFYALPGVIAMASPFACLTGTLVTIGRFTSDNEILVFLSSGFSYKAIFSPAIVIGLLISLFSFFANDILLPLGNVQFMRLYRKILFSSPALELEANSVKKFKDTVVVTGPVMGKSIRDILIIDRTNEGERRIIVAGEAGLEDIGNGKISLNLKDAFIRSGKENLRKNYDYASAGYLQYIVSMDDLNQTVYAVGPREMSSVDVKKEIILKEETLNEKVETEKRNACARAFDLEEALRMGYQNSRVEPLALQWEKSVEAVREIINDKSLSLYKLEYFKKFSIPFGAICFVLVAVAIGLMANKSGQTVGFIIGICMAALYWGLLLIGQDLGSRLGFSPFWAMWFPNILAIAAGVALTAIKVLVK